MSLVLDKRQRAMLREMGVHVWQPVPDADAPSPTSINAAVDTSPEVTQFAIDLIAASAHSAKAASTIDQQVSAKSSATAPPARTAPQPAPAPAPAPAPTPTHTPAAAGVAPGWQLGEAQALYARAAPAEGPRWLVLAETPAASLRAQPFNPFEGDAGKLLGNMLRAARLDRPAQGAQPAFAGDVLLAPLARLAAGGTATETLPTVLAALLAQTRPDVVLVMGRLAAQAVLQRSEPLGKLRGQVHQLHGFRTVVTYDAAMLLRSPQEKAKAWEDLCLAIEVSQRAT